MDVARARVTARRPGVPILSGLPQPAWDGSTGSLHEGRWQ
jgi:hypothetical protein